MRLLLQRDEFGGYTAEVAGWHPDFLAAPTTFRITFARRPHYCDRGRWLVHNDAPGLDWADGWPRYYFDLDLAVKEIETWLAGRRELKPSRAPR